jgi:hypothetical protein
MEQDPRLEQEQELVMEVEQRLGPGRPLWLVG